MMTGERRGLFISFSFCKHRDWWNRKLSDSSSVFSVVLCVFIKTTPCLLLLTLLPCSDQLLSADCDRQVQVQVRNCCLSQTVWEGGITPGLHENSSAVSRVMCAALTPLHYNRKVRSCICAFWTLDSSQNEFFFQNMLRYGSLSGFNCDFFQLKRGCKHIHPTLYEPWNSLVCSRCVGTYRNNKTRSLVGETWSCIQV